MENEYVRQHELSVSNGCTFFTPQLLHLIIKKIHCKL